MFKLGNWDVLCRVQMLGVFIIFRVLFLSFLTLESCFGKINVCVCMWGGSNLELKCGEFPA